MKDDFLRELTLTILEQLRHLWVTVPGANTIHHAYTAGTLIHSVSVAKIAKAVAETIPGAFIELATIGGLLHDLGKLFGYRINGIVCEMTDEGLLYEHTFLGAQFVNNFAEENSLLKDEKDEAKLELLCHIILTIMETREYGAAITPSSIEAQLLIKQMLSMQQLSKSELKSDKPAVPNGTERIWALRKTVRTSPLNIRMQCIILKNNCVVTSPFLSLTYVTTGSFVI